MTGPELQALAERLKTNPYYLAFALATGARSCQEAFQRDGGNHEFMIWNDARWQEQAKAEGTTREWVSVATGAMERHCAIVAAFIPAGATPDLEYQAEAPACLS